MNIKDNSAREGFIEAIKRAVAESIYVSTTIEGGKEQLCGIIDAVTETLFMETWMLDPINWDFGKTVDSIADSIMEDNHLRVTLGLKRGRRRRTPSAAELLAMCNRLLEESVVATTAMLLKHRVTHRDITHNEIAVRCACIVNGVEVEVTEPEEVALLVAQDLFQEAMLMNVECKQAI